MGQDESKPTSTLPKNETNRNIIPLKQNVTALVEYQTYDEIPPLFPLIDKNHNQVFYDQINLEGSKIYESYINTKEYLETIISRVNYNQESISNNLKRQLEDFINLSNILEKRQDELASRLAKLLGLFRSLDEEVRNTNQNLKSSIQLADDIAQKIDISLQKLNYLNINNLFIFFFYFFFFFMIEKHFLIENYKRKKLINFYLYLIIIEIILVIYSKYLCNKIEKKEIINLLNFNDFMKKCTIIYDSERYNSYNYFSRAFIHFIRGDYSDFSEFFINISYSIIYFQESNIINKNILNNDKIFIQFKNNSLISNGILLHDLDIINFSHFQIYVEIFGDLSPLVESQLIFLRKSNIKLLFDNIIEIGSFLINILFFIYFIFQDIYKSNLFLVSSFYLLIFFTFVSTFPYFQFSFFQFLPEYFSLFLFTLFLLIFRSFFFSQLFTFVNSKIIQNKLFIPFFSFFMILSTLFQFFELLCQSNYPSDLELNFNFLKYIFFYFQFFYLIYLYTLIPKINIPSFLFFTLLASYIIQLIEEFLFLNYKIGNFIYIHYLIFILPHIFLTLLTSYLFIKIYNPFESPIKNHIIGKEKKKKLNYFYIGSFYIPTQRELTINNLHLFNNE